MIEISHLKATGESLYIAGEWVNRGNRRAINDQNPYTEEIIELAQPFLGGKYYTLFELFSVNMSSSNQNMRINKRKERRDNILERNIVSSLRKIIS